MKAIGYGITSWAIGDKVKITKRSWEHIRNSNRSILAYPDDNFCLVAHRLMTKRTRGFVTERFYPGYDVNVLFKDGTTLQMKSHWIETA